MQRLIYLLLLCLVGTAGLRAQTIVERHGQLTVDGNRIKDECGRVAQVKGMSYFWSQWEGKEYYNANVVKWLRDDWKVEIVRAAVAVRGEDDYITNPTTHFNRATAVIDGAVQHGIYAIADFHAHYANQYTPQAKTFFRDISARYKGKPNIIYEIWNEPIGDYGDAGGRATWRDIKAYAREIISVIRDNDPNGLIVVGTPFYDQRPDLAAEDPLTTDSKGRPVGNVAYTIHAYAGAHKQQVRDWGQKALDAGLALFMTECGRTGTNYGPNNNIDAAEWDRWESWMDARGISYAKWSLSNKNEVSSSLQPGAPANGGWTNSQLRPEGQWNRTHFRSVNATQPSVCGGTTPPTSTPTTNRNIYTDNFNNSWANWSWGGTATAQDGGIKYAGSYSFKYYFNSGGGAASFRHPNGLTGDNLVRLEFWARTWNGNTNFEVSGSYDDNYGNRGSRTTVTVTPTWKKFSFTKAQLGNYGWYKRFFIFNGSTTNTIFLDNVRLVYSSTGSAGLGSELSIAASAPEFREVSAQAFPNPTGGNFTLEVNLPEAVTGMQVEVLDVTGRLVLRHVQDATSGSNRIPLSLPSVHASGMHLLRLSDPAGTFQLTQRLLVE